MPTCAVRSAAMVSTLQKLLVRCVQEFDMAKYPSQVPGAPRISATANDARADPLPRRDDFLDAARGGGAAHAGPNRRAFSGRAACVGG